MFWGECRYLEARVQVRGPVHAMLLTVALLQAKTGLIVGKREIR